MNNKNSFLYLIIVVLGVAFGSGSYVGTLNLNYISPDKTALKANFGPLPDFRTITDIKEKKEAFFSYLVPMVKHANQQIRNERKIVKQLAKKETLNRLDRKNLNQLAKKYGVEKQDDERKMIQTLMNRVDKIPPSLVLAQAANESAWGTSRFARKGNNLFGQWCYEPGCGMVPKYREKGAVHEVRRFPSVFESVKSYMLNINTHTAYAPVRKIRRLMRENDEPIIGSKLSEGLINYSERRESYIKEIKDMIRFNSLGDYDTPATLAQAGAS